MIMEIAQTRHMGLPYAAPARPLMAPPLVTFGIYGSPMSRIWDHLGSDGDHGDAPVRKRKKMDVTRGTGPDLRATRPNTLGT